MADDLYGPLFNAAIMWYMNQQGNKAPKFYNVPLTPFQEWQQNQTQNLYGAVGNYTNQFLGGLNNLNPSGFHFVSPALQGQQFAGGIQLPHFDLSKFQFGGQNAGGGTPGGGTGSPGPGTNMPGDATPGTGNPGVPNFGPPNGGAGAGGGAPTPPPPQGAGGANFIQNVRNWWSQFQQDHPNWATMGKDAIMALATAAFGPLGQAAAALLGHFLNGSQPSDTLPGGGSPHYTGGQPVNPGDFTPGDYLPTNNTPHYSNGGVINPADLTPANWPAGVDATKVHVDPSTGLWSIDGATPQQQAWLDSINEFNYGVMHGGSGGGSTGIGADPRYNTTGGYLGGGPFTSPGR